MDQSWIGRFAMFRALALPVALPMALGGASLGRMFALAVVLFGLSACQSLPARKIHSPSGAGSVASPPSAGGAAADSSSETGEVEGETKTATPIRLALILGPGGVRSYAHVGLLQEFVKGGGQISSIAGIEMGSLVAGLYARKGQVFDVEWQMFKLREDELSSRGRMGLGNRPQAITVMEPFFRETFGDLRAEDARVPFACASANLRRREIFVLQRGAFSEVLFRCIPAPPMFSSYQGNMAALSAVDALVRYLQLRGATHVVFVDLLSDVHPVLGGSPDSLENLIWAQSALASRLASQPQVLVFSLDLRGSSLDGFSERRNLLLKGQTGGQRLLQALRERGWLSDAK